MNSSWELGRRTLFRIKRLQYGKNYHDDLLAEYAQYYQGMEKSNEARRSNDRYFLAINTLLLTSYISLTQAKVFGNNGHWAVLISCIGVVICLIWAAVTRWYMQHHRVQRLIARLIESKLPINPLTTEDKVSRLEHPFMARHTAWLRYATPWIFAVLYLILPFLL